MREFEACIVSVSHYPAPDEDMALVRVETSSRWHPKAGTRKWDVRSDRWGGARRAAAQLVVDVGDKARSGKSRQVAPERAAACRAVVDHLDAGRSGGHKALAALPWPRDPFVGSCPALAREKVRGSYPQKIEEFKAALATFDRTQVEAALFLVDNQIETLPKSVVKALRERLSGLPHATPETTKPKRKK